MRWDMVVRPPPVPGTGYSTAYPIEECPGRSRHRQYRDSRLAATYLATPRNLIWFGCTKLFGEAGPFGDD
jgi:hypothetical protein